MTDEERDLCAATMLWVYAVWWGLTWSISRFKAECWLPTGRGNHYHLSVQLLAGRLRGRL